MMLDAIKRYFGNRLEADADDAQDGTDRFRVATCALLLEAAHADDDFSDDERDAIAEMVRRRFELDEAGAGELIDLADQERRASTDLYQFSRLIAESYTREEKLAVLELLWRVVYSDGRLEAREDALLHKLCTLLGLNHKELIALKLRVKKG